ncbi:hypothetical protein GGX14DRAFT_387329 [Mycena pura]|uniref:Uncharacterized protein n=1 Tax=Mycena pura TaxID=153505 RepID=A0AAD6YNR1_9AGAR|nr:hypothetical protein GGX14DRAFT_387329 [Mycena pura]
MRHGARHLGNGDLAIQIAIANSFNPIATDLEPEQAQPLPTLQGVGAMRRLYKCEFLLFIKCGYTGCVGLYAAADLSILLEVVLVEITLILRVLAIYSVARRGKFFVVAVAIIVISLGAWTVKDVSPALASPGCYGGTPTHRQLRPSISNFIGVIKFTLYGEIAGLWEAMFATDVVFLGLTLYRGYTQSRLLGTGLPPGSLWHVIVRDVSCRLSVTATSRLILNLREVASTDDLTSIVESSIRFAGGTVQLLKKIMFSRPSETGAKYKHPYQQNLILWAFRFFSDIECPGFCRCPPPRNSCVTPENAPHMRRRSDAQEARIIKASLDSQMAENNSIRDRFSAQLGRHARSRAKKAEKAADAEVAAQGQGPRDFRASHSATAQLTGKHFALSNCAGRGGCGVFASFRFVSEFIIQQLPLSLSPSMSTHSCADPTPQTPVRNSLRASAASVIQQCSPFSWEAALDPDIMDLTFAEIAQVTPNRSVRKRGKARWRELFPEAWEFKDLSSP